jgi:hypothetical protein
MSLRIKAFLPLLALIAIEFLWCSYLLASRRIPLGHDGFQYFYLKYYFFNEFVTNGEVAQWLPYLTHGSPSSWWYVVQSGIFDAVGLFAARLLQIRTFLPVFYVLLFLEKLLLLVGAWLLASEHLRSRAAVFMVCAAVTATTIWYTQPWWNFHALIALPMLLFLVHRVIFDFRWVWLSGLSLLFFLQTFGHLSYYVPMTLLFVAAYGALMLTRSDARAALRSRIRFSLGGLIFFLLINASTAVAMFWLQKASSDISFAFSYREPDGGVSLAVFLNYAGNTDLRTWNQLVTGITPHLDFTLFSGFLVFGLVVLSFTESGLNQAQKLFTVLTLGAFLLAAASPLATLVYYLWPLGRYFRHLSLLLPVAKLFFIMLGGATLDRLISAPQPFRRSRVYCLTAVLLPTTILLILFATSAERRTAFLSALLPGDLALHPAYDFEPGRLVPAIVAVVVTWIILFILMHRFESAVIRTRLGWAAATVLLLDVSVYHRIEMRNRTQKISREEASVFTFRALPYANQRIVTPEAPGNTRLQEFGRPLSIVIGERYWSQNLLWMADSYQTTNRTVFWSKAFGELLQARLPNEIGKYSNVLSLPVEDKLIAGIGGLDKPKIRFFSQAIACNDPAATATIVANPQYDGRVPLLTAPPENAGVSTLPCDAGALTATEVVTSPEPSAKVMSFKSNTAAFEVNNPASIPVVMTYSDAWSPEWSAQMNGKPLPLLRSALAYKAVVVPPGTSVIEFSYRDRLQQVVFALQTAGSVAFFGYFIWLTCWKLAELEVARTKKAEEVFSSATT